MPAALWPFQLSTTTAFIIEVGDFYMRFFTNRQQVKSGGLPYEIVSPYAEAHVFELQHKQINDVVYITHPDYPVHKLSRVTDTSWTLEAVVFDVPAMLDENLTDTTITISAETGNITLEASDDIFLPGHVGSYWRIGFLRNAFTLPVYINANIESNFYSFIGKFYVRTYGTWEADIVLSRRKVGGSQITEIQRWSADDDRNIDAEGTAEDGYEYRVEVQNFVAATDARVVLEAAESLAYGTVVITAVGSGMQADATVLVTLPASRYVGDPDTSLTTEFWAEGAWSDVRGYPRALTIHEQRLIFGGTAYQPTTIWGSVVADFENFLRGEADDASWVFQLASEEFNQIQWMGSKDALIIGTTAGEWRGRGNDLGDPLTQTRYDFKQKEYNGSEYLQGCLAGDALLMVERKGTTILEVTYEPDVLKTLDISLLSAHLLTSGVKQMAFQKLQIPTLWVVTNDGQLIGMTYLREQEVLGWHRHETAGLFKSVACIYGDTDADDEVWVVVERTIGSETVELVELLDPTLWTDKEDAFFVDSGLSYEGSPLTHFTGMGHLAGQLIDGLADGRPFYNVLVDEFGEFDLPSGYEPASVVHAGLPYTAQLKPYRLDADARVGMSAGRVKSINALHARLFRTSGGEYQGDGTLYTIEVPETISVPDAENPPMIGAAAPVDVPIDLNVGHDYDPPFEIFSSDPLPMTVICLEVGFTVSST